MSKDTRELAHQAGGGRDEEQSTPLPEPDVLQKRPSKILDVFKQVKVRVPNPHLRPDRRVTRLQLLPQSHQSVVETSVYKLPHVPTVEIH